MSFPRVLLVEDDKFVLKAMKLQFESVGYIVKTALDGEKAIKVLNRWIPSAVILDVLMPKMDGYEVLKKIKSTPKWQGIPVLIASNLNSESNINRGIDLSAAEFIVKSDLSLDDLVKKTSFYINASAHGQKSLLNQ